MKRIALFLAAALLLLAGLASANDGGGEVKIGYTSLDEEGSLGVNQETYNYYEGLGLSLEDWHYIWNNGLQLDANLSNITLNNRTMAASVGKPGKFRLSLNNSQYRRIYELDGANFTRRNITNARGEYILNSHFRVYGNYGVTNRKGAIQQVIAVPIDTVIRSTDYSYQNFGIGTIVGDKHGQVRAEYRHFDLNDKVDSISDRTADQLSVNVSSSVPRFSWLVVAGGYLYRTDKIDTFTVELQHQQLWGGAKAYLPYGLLVDYRGIYSITKRLGPRHEYDNMVHTVTAAKNWSTLGGLRVGYEYREALDFENAYISNGILANGWIRPSPAWYFSGQVAYRQQEDDLGETALGDEDLIRHQVQGRYRFANWGDLSARWQSRIQKNDDISSRADYNALTGELNLSRSEYGTLTFTYSYYLGEYENRSEDVPVDEARYEFEDHVFTGMVTSPVWHNLSADFGATYYRSRRSNDLEKSNLIFGARYRFMKDHVVEARYNVFNFDDFLVRDAYYTANIVEVNLIKDFTF